MLDVAVDEFLQPQRLGPAVIDGQRVHGETRLQRGVLVEIVDDDLGDGVPLELDHHPRVFVGLIAHRGDVADDLFVHQLGDALDEQGAVHVVGDFRDDDAARVSPFSSSIAELAAHLQAAAAGLEVMS